MNNSDLSSSKPVCRFRSSTIGLAFCLCSAVLYTATNICLRKLSSSGDPRLAIWFVCIKESITPFVVGPWLLFRLFSGRQEWPALRSILILLMAGTGAQLGGNVFYFWAFGVVGLAVTIPVTQGTNLTTSAFLGRLVLGERVSPRAAAAVAVLIAAIAMLSLGASHGGMTPIATSHLIVVLGVCSACLAGIVFSCLGTAIRTTVTQATSPLVVMVVTTGTAIFILGPMSVWQLGPKAMLSIPLGSFALAVLAGLLNIVAYGGLILGLKHTTVLHAYVVNNTGQTTFSTLAGIFLFCEPLSLPLLLGLGMIITGMVMMDRPVIETEAESL